MQVMIENKIWCELEARESKCFYKMFPANIPCECGGSENAPTIDGAILCESYEDATACVLAVAAMIENGYDENPCWLIGMDMKDLMENVFDGTALNFTRKTFRSSFDNESLQVLKNKVVGATVMFLSFIAPHDDATEGTEFDNAFETISSESKDATVLWQISLLNGADRTLDIWYR